MEYWPIEIRVPDLVVDSAAALMSAKCSSIQSPEGAPFERVRQDEHGRALHAVVDHRGGHTAALGEQPHASVVAGDQGAFRGGEGDVELAAGMLAVDVQGAGDADGHLGHAGEVLDVARQHGRVEGEPPHVVQLGPGVLAQEVASHLRGGGRSSRSAGHAAPDRGLRPACGADDAASREKRSTYWARWRSPRNCCWTRSWADRPRRSARAGSLSSRCSVAAKASRSCGSAIEQAVAPIGDLVLDPAHRAGHHGPALPHGLGDRQPEPLDEALLHDRVRVPLERVDDDGVLVHVVHRDRRQVHPLANAVGQRAPLRTALGQHLGAFGIVVHAGHVRPGQHEVGVGWAVHAGEPLHHAGHVLEAVPPAHLDHEGRVVGRRRPVDETGVDPYRAGRAIAPVETRSGRRVGPADESCRGEDRAHGLRRELLVLGGERVDRGGDDDEPSLVHPHRGVGAPREHVGVGPFDVRAQKRPRSLGLGVARVPPDMAPPGDAGSRLPERRW